MAGKKRGNTIKRAARTEHKASRKAARQKDHPAVVALGTVSEVADQPPLIALAIGTIVLGSALRRPVVLRSGVRMLASHVIATGIKTGLKRSIDRTRPRRAIADAKHRLSKSSGADDTDLNSFPSGHTAGAVAIAEAVARDAPGMALPMRAAAGSIGAVQLPRGAHYLSDVAVGAVIGWLSERLASMMLDSAERRLTGIGRKRVRAAASAEAEAHPS